MKILLFISFIIIIIFLIYLTTIDKEVYYLNISIEENENSYDKYICNYLEEKQKLERYITGYIDSNDRVTDLINIIDENKSIKINNQNQAIKNSLIKADLVTIFIGLNDINYKIGYSNINELYNYADSFLEDLEEMLKIVREYCKEDIILIGYYNIYGSYYDEYFDYINREAELICKDYDIEFISSFEIYDSDKHIDNILLNKQENKIISEKIIEVIDRKILDTASEGDNVGILLDKIDRNQISRGDIITK